MPPDFVDRLRDLLATVRSAQTLLASESDQARLDRVVRLAVSQTRATAGVLYVLDDDRGDLVIAAASDAQRVGTHVGRVGLPGFVIDDGAPIAAASPGGDSQAVAPILVFGVAAGALEVQGASGPKGFTPDDVALVQELAHVAASAVEAHRGERLLGGMFAAVLPRALEGGGLAAELARWIDEVRAQPGFRRELALVAKLRAIARDDAGLRLVEDVIDAVLRSRGAP
jgi:GAF domain-containing protein